MTGAKVLRVQNNSHLNNLISHHYATRETWILQMFKVAPKRYVIITSPKRWEGRA